MESASYIEQKFSLVGRTAIVTGASRGLGQSIAVSMGRAGANVCLVGRQPNLQETATLMRQQGASYMEVICDQTTPEGVSLLFDTIAKQWGKLDILVNNAGTFLRKPSVDWTGSEWDNVMDVNLRSVFMLSQAAGRMMLAHRSGKIINIASVLSFQGGYTVPAYAASRHGVIGLTKALANEWASQGINVNAVAPGYMDTEQNAALFSDPVRSRDLMARIPAARWGKRDEIDGACLFLASGAADYMHGQVIVVDGGWMGR